MKSNLKKQLFNNNLILFFAFLLLTCGCGVSSTRKILKGEISTTHESGIEGKAVADEKFNYLEGARIFAYTDINFDSSKYYVSEPTGKDGTYKLFLPEGQYFIVAKKSVTGETFPGKLQKGDYYCYYGGNPVIVKTGNFASISLNCSRKNVFLTYEKSEEKKSGIAGKTSYKNQPLDGVYVLIFENTDKNFRGTFFAISPPTDKDGNFKIDLEPGKYYILAKKMVKSGEPYIHPFGKGKIIERISLTAGPLKQGDYYNYYDENPVEVKANYYARIDLPCVTKIGGDDRTFYNVSLAKTRIEGRVVGDDNKPVTGAYAFLTTNRLIEGKPDYISNPTKEDGKFVIYVAEPGWYHMGARNYLGRPTKAGDMYGYYNDVSNNLIEIKENEVITDITIKISLVK